MSASEPLYQGKSTYQLSWEKKITYSFVLYIKIHLVAAQHLQWLSIILIQVYLINKNNNSHLGQVLLVSRIAWARRGKYNTTLHKYLNRRWALHCQNVMTSYLTPYPHEWLRENFSLQYQYNIKYRSDENKVKYQLGDYLLIQYQILQIYIITIVWQTVRRITNEILGVKGLRLTSKQ